MGRRPRAHRGYERGGAAEPYSEEWGGRLDRVHGCDISAREPGRPWILPDLTRNRWGVVPLKGPEGWIQSPGLAAASCVDPRAEVVQQF